MPEIISRESPEPVGEQKRKSRQFRVFDRASSLHDFIISTVLSIGFLLTLADNQTAVAQSCAFTRDPVQLRLLAACQITEAESVSDHVDRAPVWGLATATPPASVVVHVSTRADDNGWRSFGSYSVLRLDIERREPEGLLFLDHLRRWGIDATDGLGVTFQNEAFRLAFAPRDALDASRRPDKGGPGIGLLFRYSFEKHNRLARNPDP